MPSRQRSDALPRYPRRTAEPPGASAKFVLRKLRHHGKRRHKKGNEEHRGKFVISHPIEERPASAANRSVRGHWEADTVVGKQGKACLVTLVDRKSRYLLGGKAMSKTAAAVNLHTIYGRAGPMKTPMAFYGSSFRRAKTSRIRQRITSNGSTMS
ncbi:IS30 family transposase [uncultured Mitsuokella sp.]|uniref:IS30 family transposase n=1 Tax=uncultured Mitsuokella sp. TaxID=453120 RepID=UPI00266FFF68|nr:IS30 family transposase [uncultured Mitsuokella sp.]